MILRVSASKWKVQLSAGYHRYNSVSVNISITKKLHLLFFLGFSIFDPFVRLKKKRMINWPEPTVSLSTTQSDQLGDWQLQEDRRGAKQDEQEEEGSTKKDDDISVLLEDSDDEWIPGMLKN